MTALGEDELARLRPGLLAYCYQMLGSPFEAEDAVQDALERAWRARDGYDPARAALTTWCYRIAHNVCVDRLRGTARRPLPRDLQDPGIEVGAPLVPALDVPWLMPAPRSWLAASEVEGAVGLAAEVRLAVTAMLQSLPARQRGAFVLREVLGCSAAETADVLGTTVPAVNSALQRARAVLGVPADQREGDETLDRDRVERYALAIERADVPALAALVADDVVLEMPPVRSWSRGRPAYGDFMRWVFESRGTSWASRIVEGIGQPVLLLYLGTGAGAVPHSVQLLATDASGAVDHVLVYWDPRLFALFEGPRPAGR